MNQAIPLVLVVDDDDAVRGALIRLIRSAGYRVEGFCSATDFLRLRPADDHTACLVLDVSMPGLSGLDLQRRLNAASVPWPVIFITGHGDVPTIVTAMKAGAADFLAKPVADTDLIEAVARALGAASQARLARMEREAIRHRLARLTPREQEVMALLVQGRLNKQAAYELGIAEKTIKVHRARVMEKMEARSLVELARATDKIGLTAPPPAPMR